MKIIFEILRNEDLAETGKGINNLKNAVKLIIFETEIKNDNRALHVITLKPDSINRVSKKLLIDLLSNDNQIFLIVPEDDETVPGQNTEHFNINYLKKGMNPRGYSLTRQQKQVMDLLSEKRLRLKEIGEVLNLSYHTIKHHVSNVKQRMDVHTLAEAIDEYMLYKHRYN
jgi:DNA-binding CsgD family transcriptional regulator